MYLIGTSGWSYKEWYRVFYPLHVDNREMLSYYSQHYDTVEVNSSFYSPPSRKMVEYWYRKTPIDFVFSVKMFKLFTHKHRLVTDRENIIDFIDIIKGLRSKLGPILIQLPPSLKANIDILESFLNMLPEGYKYSLEFRHKSWLKNPKVFETLQKYNVAYVAVDEPLLPPVLKVTSDFSYIRFHGHGKKIWYDYKYSEDELKKWVPKIKDVSSSVKNVFIYFNNHFHGNAINDSLVMKKLLGIEDKRGIMQWL
ncbi:MAG: DUF72 domain-containing protein [Thermoproteales archaeon]|nr:DUF72 domain-containing protein [Thermoproteales archaeon]